MTCGIIVFAVSFYWLNGTKHILKDYEKIQNPHIENNSSQFEKNKSVSSLPLKSLIKILISSGVLTVLISIAIQGALKDSVTQWIPTFLNSKYKVTTGFSLLLTMLLPIINVTGAYFAKAINKKIKNEFLTSAVFFGISAIFLMILFTVKSAGAIISVICMAGVTNCMFAINVMLITMVPLKFSEYGRTGTVGGFLNAFAYIGCGIINLGSGALLEKSGSQWNSLILMWLILAAAAFLITAACSIIWKKIYERKIIMIRKLTYKDKNEYCKFAMEFYNSDAVLHTIPAEYIEKTFTELMRSDEYVQCFILETENKTAGYALLSKTFSQECGGYVIWIEELFILKQFRRMGLGSEFFSFIEKTFRQQDTGLKQNLKTSGRFGFMSAEDLSRLLIRK